MIFHPTGERQVMAVSRNLYELIALGARYVFAGLMVLIVLRAWRITLIDARRAASLRRLSPQTGLSGELLVLEGNERASRGMRYPVIREGMIGSSRRSDIRLRHSSIRRKHAWFQLTQDGLTVRARPGAAMHDGAGRRVSALTLPDGGEFTLGKVRLLLVLNLAPERPEPPRREHRGEPDDRENYDDGDYGCDDAFPPDYDAFPPDYDAFPDYDATPPPDENDLFLDQPVLRRKRE